MSLLANSRQVSNQIFVICWLFLWSALEQFSYGNVNMNSKEEIPDHPKSSSFHIIVNARPREVTGEYITYDQVVALAFSNDPNASQFLYSVHYVGPHMPDGTLAEGQSATLKNGMKFDVTKTNRS